MQELALLNDESRVFKLIGPALVKQDPKDAQQNVDKRIEFIQNEMCARAAHAARTPTADAR